MRAERFAMKKALFILCITLAASVAMAASTAMPTTNLTNWRLIFTDDFTTSVALGGFPGPYSQKWDCYSGFHSTDKIGWYDRAIISVIGGILDMYIHTDSSTGKALTAAPVPLIKGGGQWGGMLRGRYSVRFRSDSLPGYKTAWLLWPDSDNWTEGEIDFPEGGLDGTIGAFSHCNDGVPNNNCFWANTQTTYTGWHVATIEWAPTYLSFILDDVVIGTTTKSNAIPKTPFHWVLQTETNFGAPSPSVAGHLQIDWVAIWAYDVSATIPCSGSWSDNFNTINSAKWKAADGENWSSVYFSPSQVSAGASGLAMTATTVGCPSLCGNTPTRSGKLNSVATYATGTVQFTAQTASNAVLWLYWEQNNNPRDGWEVYFSGTSLTVQYYSISNYNWGGSYTLAQDTATAARKFTIVRSNTSFQVYQGSALVFSKSGSNLPTTSGQLSFVLLEGGGTATPRTETVKITSFSYLPAGCSYTL